MLARRLLNRGLLTVGSGLLIAIGTTVVILCLYLLSNRQGDQDGFALATVIMAFISTVFAVLPATGMAAFMIFKSFRFGDAPYHCLPLRMKDPFRGASAAAFALSAIPCALGISLPSNYATCTSDHTGWHQSLPCSLLKASWALCLVMLTLTLLVLLPLRSAVRTSALIPTKPASDTESTSSFEKPPMTAYTWLAAERLPTREQQRWLQRHNSLSSQKAIYPYAFDSMRQSTSWASSGYSPFPRPPSAWQSSSDGQRTWSSSGSTVYFSRSRPSTYRPSTAGSRPPTGLSLSSGSTYSRRYRSDHSANCPAIPESPHRLSNHDRPKTANDIPALPSPAWCPQLTHAPLSSDPAIRALTGPRSRLSQRQSRLPALTGISPVLSRQSTTSTSVLEFGISRPSTAPSVSTSSAPMPRISSPAFPAMNFPNVAPTFATIFGTGLSTPPLEAPTSSLPPLPLSSPVPPEASPPAIPRRARGHVLSPPTPLQPQIRSPSLTSSPVRPVIYSPLLDCGSVSGGRSGSGVRVLRRPSPLRIRTDSSQNQQVGSQVEVSKGIESVSPLSQAGVVARSQSRGHSSEPHDRISPSASKAAPSMSPQKQVESQQPPPQRYRGRTSTKKVERTASSSAGKSVSRGRRTRSNALTSSTTAATTEKASSPPPVPRDERTTLKAVSEERKRKSTAAVVMTVLRGRSVSVHEQRGREKIQRGNEGCYTPSCYSVVSGVEPERERSAGV